MAAIGTECVLDRYEHRAFRTIKVSFHRYVYLVDVETNVDEDLLSRLLGEMR